MGGRQFKGVAISDFNISNFVGYVNNDQEQPAVEAVEAPYGQVYQVLMRQELPLWQAEPDFALVWTQPQGVIESFKYLLASKPVDREQLLAEVDGYADLLLGLQQRVSNVFVPTWMLPSYHRGWGMLDMRHEQGLTNALMRMNLRLADRLEEAPNIYMLNASRWVELAGRSAFNPKYWYMAKVPFGNGVFKEAVRDVKAALRGIAGQAKKLVIVDLDDTLWGGIVGDAGWENLQLGGHDPAGEAFVAFQQELKALTNRGILLAIVSKNEESVAMEALQNHPEMVLTPEDFAGWRINWQDKAQNIADLVSELNLGLQSVVFIDDNHMERARVRETLPEVLVPEWPEDKMLYQQTLLSLTCFDTPAISREDVTRAKMYATERQRKELRTQVGSVDEWLNTLDIRVEVEALNEANLTRTAQLLNKTNQMNLSTRRMTETELVAWVEEQAHELWTFRVSDRFGESGLTGIISLEVEGARGRIVDFILSCRVMGRKIEETMLATVVEYARDHGLSEVYAQYLPTAKNKPCLEFWRRSGFQSSGENDTFCWETTRPYPVPEQVTVKLQER